MPLPAGDGLTMARSFLRDHIHTELHRAIVNGDLQPGERLRVEDIMDRFGGSRFPVRDALARLATEGFVVIKPQSGTIVSAIDPEAFQQSLVVLSALCSAVFREAVPLLTESDKQTLARYRAEVLSGPEAGRAAVTSGRAVRDFYDVFFDRYGDSVMKRVRDEVFPPVLRVYNAVAADHAALFGAGQELLRQVVDEAHAGHADRAGDAIAEYMTTVGARVSVLLAETQEGDA